MRRGVSMTNVFNWQSTPGEIQWAPKPPKRQKKPKAVTLSAQAKAEKVVAFLPFHLQNFVGPS